MTLADVGFSSVTELMLRTPTTLHDHTLNALLKLAIGGHVGRDVTGGRLALPVSISPSAGRSSPRMRRQKRTVEAASPVVVASVLLW